MIISPEEIRKEDILCTRGNGVAAHIGNMNYTNLIKEKKVMYQSGTCCRLKKAIVHEVLNILKSSDPPARFLKSAAVKSGIICSWTEIKDENELIKKVAQALREKPKIRGTKKKTIKSTVSSSSPSPAKLSGPSPDVLKMSPITVRKPSRIQYHTVEDRDSSNTKSTSTSNVDEMKISSSISSSVLSKTHTDLSSEKPAQIVPTEELKKPKKKKSRKSLKPGIKRRRKSEGNQKLNSYGFSYEESLSEKGPAVVSVDFDKTENSSSRSYDMSMSTSTSASTTEPSIILGQVAKDDMMTKSLTEDLGQDETKIDDPIMERLRIFNPIYNSPNRDALNDSSVHMIRFEYGMAAIDSQLMDPLPAGEEMLFDHLENDGFLESECNNRI
jgi:hypothetical protein